MKISGQYWLGVQLPRCIYYDLATFLGFSLFVCLFVFLILDLADAMPEQVVGSCQSEEILSMIQYAEFGPGSPTFLGDFQPSIFCHLSCGL